MGCTLHYSVRWSAMSKTKMMCGDVGQNQSDTHDRRSEGYWYAWKGGLPGSRYH